MKAVFIVFLFAMSLLAIALACAILVFIGNQLKLARTAEQGGRDVPAASEDSDTDPIHDSEQIAQFLSKMKAATLIGVLRPQKRVDDQDVN